MIRVPEILRRACAAGGAGAWLDSLPATIRDIADRWSLDIGAPFDGASCAWVAPAVLLDGTQGVLKLGMPHMEALDEAAGLRFWDGDGIVRLLRHDAASGALLLERCVPGSSLRKSPEDGQDAVIAGLLHRLWRDPTAPHPFRPLIAMLDAWTAETLRDEAYWPDSGLVSEGLGLFRSLCESATSSVLLVTDLHAGNVLAARREPWLAIDPKPFLGDPAFDATQHLLNCRSSLRSDPAGRIRRFADRLEIDAERVRLWLFARAAAEPRRDWSRHPLHELATRLS